MTKLYIAGHRGMVGGAILRRLQARKAAGEALELITQTHADLDLTSQQAVRDFMQAEKPDVVILAAARVGGIHANNTYPAEFIYENLMIECNVIHQAFAAGVTRLLQLGSSCIYPRAAPQPMREDALLTGVLGADERALCRGQDRRDQAVRELQPAIRHRLPLGHADQSLRAGRQFPPREFPRHARPDPPLP